MKYQRGLVTAVCVLLIALTLSPVAANAKTNEYEKIVKHLKTNYRAKKVSIPFMWLAKIAVKVVRPAGKLVWA